LDRKGAPGPAREEKSLKVEKGRRGSSRQRPESQGNSKNNDKTSRVGCPAARGTGHSAFMEKKPRNRYEREY